MNIFNTEYQFGAEHVMKAEVNGQTWNRTSGHVSLWRFGK
uniref:Uncharacterized protein n=1 Tax=Anguilla anguilla TaxID=7936 RepID=A0A0E9QTX1_ANGAN